MSIEQQLDTGRAKRITENRNKIKAIIVRTFFFEVIGMMVV